jgi:uncharacterized protein (DUF2252 family)
MASVECMFSHVMNLQSTVARREFGQSRRKQLRRQDHGHWDPKSRPRSALSIVEESMRGRVPTLVALKYERMAASAFGYFRGAVPVMAADLALLTHTGILTQICGDAHVRNLGAYAGPDGRLIFDINDFDETARGPFEWDIKRMATSLVLAGREAGNKNSACDMAVAACVQRYRKTMQMFTRMPVIDIARFQIHRLQRIALVSEVLFKAERATPLHSLEQLTVEVAAAKGAPGHRIYKEQKPLLTRVTGAKAREVLASLNAYRETLLPERQHFLAQYRPIDVAFKVVGTGSVGTRDYCIYFEGNGADDPLFLQVKEELPSSYAPYLDRVPHIHQGRRTADGQRAMQFQSDPFLGWTTIANRDYLVRQLNDHKASIDVGDLKGEGLIDYAEISGELLARGHARSGDCFVLAGYLGNGRVFQKAITAFANAYANQTVQDWKALLRSKHAPRITTPADARAATKE